MIDSLTIIYLITVLIPISTYGLIETAYKKRKKRLGYVDIRTMGKLEKLIVVLPDLIKVLAISLCPLYNVLYAWNLLNGYEEAAKNSIMIELADHQIKKIDSLEKSIPEKEYLNERIKEIKDYQKKLGIRNQVTSISEYNVDEKIAFLLRELELAYEEKAKIEDINLNEPEEELKLILKHKEDRI